MEGLALAEALVDPVLVAGPHGLGGDLGREPIAPDPADHLIRLLTVETRVVDNRRKRWSTIDQSARLLH